jgi:hypothetical protein
MEIKDDWKRRENHLEQDINAQMQKIKQHSNIVL